MEAKQELNPLNKNIELKKSIKSIYILQYILSFITKKRKLTLILHNKNYQAYLGYDLDYYKKTSGKYKIVGNDGKGKVYELDTNILLFEGEYLNRKKNGKGIEYFYNEDKIKFDGEYLNDKKIKGKEYDFSGNIILVLEENGKGKEFNYKGKILFEGEYLNGKRWNGKGYDPNDNEEFEIKYGKGFGREYYFKGGLKFEGEYINGEKNGKGKEYDID